MWLNITTPSIKLKFFVVGKYLNSAVRVNLLRKKMGKRLICYGHLIILISKKITIIFWSAYFEGFLPSFIKYNKVNYDKNYKFILCFSFSTVLWLFIRLWGTYIRYTHLFIHIFYVKFNWIVFFFFIGYSLGYMYTVQYIYI